MEICELNDLRKLSTRRIKAGKPLSWFQATHILMCAARGIDFLHSNGVLHRDIKTENLLVCKGMSCKIGDFGMARQEAVSRGAMDNKRMTLCGTDEFMAPEILFEEPYVGFAMAYCIALDWVVLCWSSLLTTMHCLSGQ